MTDIVEQAARILDEHSDMTDRSAQDGCECGYPDPLTVNTHQAQALADAGLLADRATPTREQIAEAVAPIAFNAANYPKPGESTTPFVTKIADAVLALIADQPTVAEAKAWDEGARAGLDAGLAAAETTQQGNLANLPPNPYR